MLIQNKKKKSRETYLGQQLGLHKSQDKNGCEALNIPFLMSEFSALKSCFPLFNPKCSSLNFIFLYIAMITDTAPLKRLEKVMHNTLHCIHVRHYLENSLGNQLIKIK